MDKKELKAWQTRNFKISERLEKIYKKEGLEGFLAGLHYLFEDLRQTHMETYTDYEE